MAGVQFRPGGAFPFFGMPAGELANQHVGLDAVWGRRAAELRDRLQACRTPEARLMVLEEVMQARASRDLERHPAVNFALHEFRGGTRAVSDVTGQIGLSRRRFVDVFRDQVGLAPKLFCRVRRFQRVLRHIRAGHPVDWADLAVRTGYFDQAHFIHDFHASSGIIPTAYARQELQYGNHVPIRD